MRTTYYNCLKIPQHVGPNGKLQHRLKSPQSPRPSGKQTPLFCCLSVACRTNNKISDDRHKKKKKKTQLTIVLGIDTKSMKRNTSAKTTKHVNMDEQQSEKWMNHLHYHLL